MTLIKWNPNGNTTSPAFSGLLDNFFGREFSDFLGRDFVSNVPAVNIHESAEKYTVEVAAPGLKKENFRIALNNNVLTIASKVEQTTENTEGKYTRREFGFRTFERSFTLPNTVDTERVEAKYTDGILHVYLPKKEEARKKPVRQIDIQ
jgi:HSP20 family protein